MGKKILCAGILLFIHLIAYCQCDKAKVVKIFIDGETSNETFRKVWNDKWAKCTSVNNYELILDSAQSKLVPGVPIFQDAGNFHFSLTSCNLVRQGDSCIFYMKVKCERRKNLVVSSNPQLIQFTDGTTKYVTQSEIENIYPDKNELTLTFVLAPQNISPPVPITVYLKKINRAESNRFSKDELATFASREKAKEGQGAAFGSKQQRENAIKRFILGHLKIDEIVFTLKDSGN